MKRYIILGLFAAFFMSCYALNYYVPEDFTTIQTGIDQISNGDNLIISPGTYYENIDFLGKAIRVASLYYTTGDTSYVSETIIDGSAAGSVVTITDCNIFDVHLCGLTIQNGLSQYGGGIFCHNAHPELSHLIIRNNVASGSMAIDMGGGIYCEDSDVIISHVRIENNTGERCGGFYSYFCNPELSNVEFYNNSSDVAGGGVYAYHSDLTFTDGKVIGNHALRGGGLFSVDSNTFLAGVTFTDNLGTYDGGAIYNEDTLEFSSENRCSIYLNNNENRAGGNEIFSSSDQVIEVFIDTFTVMNPTGFHAMPPENFIFDIQNCIYEQIESDLYVSPDGDNSNSGLSADEPLKTIQYACSVILAYSGNPHTIHLSAGVFSSSSNGEFFPVFLPPYVSITGAGSEFTTLNASQLGGVLKAINCGELSISSLELVNGMELISTGGLQCENTVANISDLKVTSCFSESASGGISLQQGNYSLENIHVFNNTGGEAGGMSVYSCSQVNIDNSIIEDNYSDIDCGGIALASGSVNISNSIIRNNTAQIRSGGIGIYFNGSYHFENVEIFGNQALESYGGGITALYPSSLELSNVSITHNSCNGSGGGIYLTSAAQCCFDSENLCSIYLNNSGIRAEGSDLFSSNTVDVIVDTFTVAEPTDFHAFPIDNFTFTIQNSIFTQVSEDLYVSPDGNNLNSGLTPEEPLKTIQCACFKIMADSLEPHTIFLLPGTYSLSSNGESLPVSLPDNVSLTGVEQGEIILDGEYSSTVVTILNSQNNTISNMKIINGFNDTDSGGIYILNSSPLIQNVTFQYNSNSRSYGGAVFICQDSGTVLSDLRVQYNNAAHGGGIAVYSATAYLENVLIEGNSVSRNGGGLCCCDSDVYLNNVNINENNAERDGAGIFCDNSSITVNRSLLYGNNALDNGGSIRCKESSNLLITNTTITQNLAQAGSGIYANYYSSVYIINSILWDNDDEEVWFNAYNNDNTLCIVYSDIEDGEDGIQHNASGNYHLTEGNINIEPMFTHPGYEEFELQEDSPCIDTATDYFEFEGEILINLSDDEFSGIAPDMGAFEFEQNASNEFIIQNEKTVIQNYPNPFNPVTTIYFSTIEDTKNAEIEIYNIKGQRIRKFKIQNSKFKINKVAWDGTNDKGEKVGSAIYYYKLMINGVPACSNKMLLIK